VSRFGAADRMRRDRGERPRRGGREPDNGGEEADFALYCVRAVRAVLICRRFQHAARRAPGRAESAGTADPVALIRQSPGR
jgi:hypothetical protein